MKVKLIGYDPELAVDKYFYNLASSDKKMILGLDEIESRFKLFDFEGPLETQVKIVEASILKAEQQAHAEQPLFNSYFSQDTEAFREAFLTLMNLENP